MLRWCWASRTGSGTSNNPPLHMARETHVIISSRFLCVQLQTWAERSCKIWKDSSFDCSTVPLLFKLFLIAIYLFILLGITIITYTDHKKEPEKWSIKILLFYLGGCYKARFGAEYLGERLAQDLERDPACRYGSKRVKTKLNLV